jgi:hypothetical protein
MRLFTARFVTLATLVPVLALFVFVPGCAKQSEGERCGDDDAIDSEDCDDGLVCVVKSNLLNNAVHRCCYPDGRVTDSRCEPAGSAPVVGAAGGAGKAGGSSVGGGGSSVGGGTGVAGSLEAGAEGS